MTQNNPTGIPPIPEGAPPTAGMAIASMCCGIGALLVVCVPCLSLVSIPSAITGIVLGAIVIPKVNRGEASGKGMAIAGIICGAVALLLYAIAIIFFLVSVANGGVHAHRPFGSF